MGYEAAPLARRKPTNVSIDSELLSQAKSLGINVSRACEDGLRIEVQGEKERQWLAENADAIQAANEHFEKHGLPLAHLRLF